MIYTSQFDANGVPSLATYQSVSHEVIQEARSFLPEGNSKSTDFYRPEWYICNDVHITEDNTTVSVTFLDEGAGHRNALGFYVYDTHNPAKNRGHLYRDVDLCWLFPNTSMSGSGGNLSPGATMQIPYSYNTFKVNDKTYMNNITYEFPKGKSIGFFISSNGWMGSGVKKSRSNLMFSNPAYNRERTLNKRYHTIAYQSQIESDRIIVGFEDLHRERASTDHDFNDLIIQINVDVSRISSSSYIATGPIYQTVDHKGTLMMEDILEEYGRKPNHDYNDMVMQYDIKEILDGDKLHQLDLTYTLLNRGAEYDHRLRFIAPFHGVTIRKQVCLGGVLQPVEVKTDVNQDSLILYDSDKYLLPPHEGDFSSNTKNGWESNPVPFSYIRYQVTWNEDIDRSSFPQSSKYLYVFDVYSGNAPYGKYLYSIRSDTKYGCTTSTELSAEGLTKVPKVLFAPDYDRFRVSKERRATHRAYKHLLKLFKDNEESYQWWHLVQVDSRLSQFVEPSPVTFDASFD